MRTKLEQMLGAEEASWLMDRPPGGWGDLVTNETLRLTIDALRSDLRTDIAELRAELRTEMVDLSASVDRRLRAQTWMSMSTLIAGLALAATIGRFG